MKAKYHRGIQAHQHQKAAAELREILSVRVPITEHLCERLRVVPSRVLNGVTV